ncbi:DUF6396 domain-containing protein [Providencia sneebia]|uniref:DUF6396 domain-containing protein n=1 Tax=Providencia sneebia TaxID=516075 RepID=UPI003AF32968
MGITKDHEISKHHEKYRYFLTGNEYCNFIIPDVNKIIPLLPAELPKFSENLPKIKKSITEVEKPSEDIMIQLAKDKNLNADTGLPL